jgi:hypothetical protein
MVLSPVAWPGARLLRRRNRHHERDRKTYNRKDLDWACHFSHSRMTTLKRDVSARSTPAKKRMETNGRKWSPKECQSVNFFARRRHHWETAQHVGSVAVRAIVAGRTLSSGSLAMLAAIRWGLFTDEQLTGVFA